MIRIRKMIHATLIATVLSTGGLRAGTLLVANKSSASVSIVDEESLQVRTHVTVGSHPHEVAISTNGRLALVSNYGTSTSPGNTLSVIDLALQKNTGTITLPAKSRPHGLYFLDETRALVTVEGIQQLLLVDAASQDVVRSLALPGNGAHLIAVRADRSFAYVTNNVSGTVCQVNLDLWKVMGEQKIGKAAEGITMIDQDRRMMVSNLRESTVTELDAETLQILSQQSTAQGPTRATVLDDGERVLVTSAIGGKLEVFAWRNGQKLASYAAADRYFAKTGKPFGRVLPVPITILPRGDQHSVYVSNSFAGYVGVIDINSGATIAAIQTQKEPDGLARTD